MESPETQAKANKIQSMFGSIARSYDRANHILSFGIDFYWRRQLVKLVKASKPHRVADLATGSGDVAIALKKALGPDVQITGLDFCNEMLDQAKAKDKSQSIHFHFGDCTKLPIADDALNAVTIAFGLRNVIDRKKALSEMHRILDKDTGRLFILEFSKPRMWIRPFYFIYLRGLLPLLAWLTTGNASSYKYLGTSIQGFPEAPQLAKEIKDAGFAKVIIHPLSQGIVMIHEAIIK